MQTSRSAVGSLMGGADDDSDYSDTSSDSDGTDSDDDFLPVTSPHAPPIPPRPAAASVSSASASDDSKQAPAPAPVGHRRRHAAPEALDFKDKLSFYETVAHEQWVAPESASGGAPLIDNPDFVPTKEYWDDGAAPRAHDQQQPRQPPTPSSLHRAALVVDGPRHQALLKVSAANLAPASSSSTSTGSTSAMVVVFSMESVASQLFTYIGHSEVRSEAAPRFATVFTLTYSPGAQRNVLIHVYDGQRAKTLIGSGGPQASGGLGSLKDDLLCAFVLDMDDLAEAQADQQLVYAPQQVTDKHSLRFARAGVLADPSENEPRLMVSFAVQPLSEVKKPPTAVGPLSPLSGALSRHLPPNPAAATPRTSVPATAAAATAAPSTESHEELLTVGSLMTRFHPASSPASAMEALNLFVDVPSRRLHWCAAGTQRSLQVETSVKLTNLLAIVVGKACGFSSSEDGQRAPAANCFAILALHETIVWTQPEAPLAPLESSILLTPIILALAAFSPRVREQWVSGIVNLASSVAARDVPLLTKAPDVDALQASHSIQARKALNERRRRLAAQAANELVPQPSSKKPNAASAANKSADPQLHASDMAAEAAAAVRVAAADLGVKAVPHRRADDSDDEDDLANISSDDSDNEDRAHTDRAGVMKLPILIPAAALAPILAPLATPVLEADPEAASSEASSEAVVSRSPSPPAVASPEVSPVPEVASPAPGAATPIPLPVATPSPPPAAAAAAAVVEVAEPATKPGMLQLGSIQVPSFYFDPLPLYTPVTITVRIACRSLFTLDPSRSSDIVLAVFQGAPEFDLNKPAAPSALTFAQGAAVFKYALLDHSTSIPGDLNPAWSDRPFTTTIKKLASASEQHMRVNLYDAAGEGVTAKDQIGLAWVDLRGVLKAAMSSEGCVTHESTHKIVLPLAHPTNTAVHAKIVENRSFITLTVTIVPVGGAAPGPNPIAAAAPAVAASASSSQPPAAATAEPYHASTQQLVSMGLPALLESMSTPVTTGQGNAAHFPPGTQARLRFAVALSYGPPSASAPALPPARQIVLAVYERPASASVSMPFHFRSVTPAATLAHSASQGGLAKLEFELLYRSGAGQLLLLAAIYLDMLPSDLRDRDRAQPNPERAFATALASADELARCGRAVHLDLGNPYDPIASAGLKSVSATLTVQLSALISKEAPPVLAPPPLPTAPSPAAAAAIAEKRALAALHGSMTNGARFKRHKLSSSSGEYRRSHITLFAKEIEGVSSSRSSSSSSSSSSRSSKRLTFALFWCPRTKRPSVSGQQTPAQIAAASAALCVEVPGDLLSFVGISSIRLGRSSHPAFAHPLAQSTHTEAPSPEGAFFVIKGDEGSRRVELALEAVSQEVRDLWVLGLVNTAKSFGHRIKVHQ